MTAFLNITASLKSISSFSLFLFSFLKVHLVFNTHLDVGYVDLTDRVCGRFFFNHYPTVHHTQQQLEHDNSTVKKKKKVYLFFSSYLA